MNNIQKKELDFLLKARKRADKVLAQRRESVMRKQEYQTRLVANADLKKKFTDELAGLARQSGILFMAEQAAKELGADLTQELSCYLDYGMTSSCIDPALVTGKTGELRAGFLALHITWGENNPRHQAEVRVYPNGQLLFHHSIIPVFPFLWKRFPGLLKRMLSDALQQPRKTAAPSTSPGTT